MASKKFSRLSIMLQATNRMSKPMQQAAQSAQMLQRRVNSLSGSVNKNQQGYNNLSNSINNTQSKMGKLATSIGKAAKESALAYVAHKALTNQMKAAKIIGLSYADMFEELGYEIGKAWRQSKLFARTTKTYKTLKTDLRIVNYLIGDSVRKTKLYQAATASVSKTAKVYRTIRNDVRILNYTIGNAVKNSKAFTLVSSAVQGVRKRVISTAIAFTLWKNSSIFVQKLKQDISNVGKAFQSVKRGLSSLIPKFQGLQKNLLNMNRNLQQTGGRRATFNQLAAANAKLNKELARTNAELSKANSRLGRMKTSLGHLNMMGAAFGTFYAGKAAAHTGGRILENTVGTAMQQQYSSQSVGILAGAEKGAAYWKQIQDYASTTAYSAADWAQSLRGAIGRSKTVEDLQKFQLAIEQLATLDPVQGLEGSALAVRELLSGDAMSLVRRFELPRKVLNSFKNLKDPMQQLDRLMEVVGKTTGFTVEAIQDMKKLPLMQWQKMTNIIKTAMGYIGSGALEKIAPLIERFNKAWENGELAPFIEMATDKFTKLAEKTLNFFFNLNKGFDTAKIREKFRPFINLVENIKATVIEAWPTISGILDDARVIAGHLADEFNNNWPQINNLLQIMLGYVKDVTGWIANHWQDTKDIVAAFAIAFASFKVLSGIVLIWNTFTKAIALWRAGLLLATVAQWAMNTALFANPIGLVIGAIAALIGIGYLLYRNWDTVSAKVMELWEKMGAFRGVLIAVFWPLTTLIGFGVELIKNWNKIKSAADVWYLIRKSLTEQINLMIDSINWLIEKMNKIPGVNIPLIPKIEMPKIPANMLDLNLGDTRSSARQQQLERGLRGGINYVPYDGYRARLHKGERVLTSQENKDHDKEKGVLVSGNTFIVRKESDIDDIAEKLLNKLHSAKTAMG